MATGFHFLTLAVDIHEPMGAGQSTQRAGFTATKDTNNEAVIRLSDNPYAYRTLIYGEMNAANMAYPHDRPIQIIPQIPDWARESNEVFDAYKKLPASQVINGTQGYMLVDNGTGYLIQDRRSAAGSFILRWGGDAIPARVALRILPEQYQPVINGRRYAAYFVAAIFEVHLNSWYILANDPNNHDILYGHDPKGDTSISWEAKVPDLHPDMNIGGHSGKKHWFYFSRTQGTREGGAWPPIDLNEQPWFSMYSTEVYLCTTRDGDGRYDKSFAEGDWGKTQGWSTGRRIPMEYIPDTDFTSPYYKRFRAFCESLQMRADCVMDKHIDPIDRQICQTLGLAGSRNAELFHQCRINPGTADCVLTSASDMTMRQFCAQNPTHPYCACGPVQMAQQFDVAFPVSAMREFKDMLLASPNCWAGHKCKPGVAYLDEAMLAAQKSVCNYKVCIQNANITGDSNIMDKLLMGIDCSTTVQAPPPPPPPGSDLPPTPDPPKPPLLVDQNQPGYSDGQGGTSSTGTSGEMFIRGGTSTDVPRAGDTKDIVKKALADDDEEDDSDALIMIVIVIGAAIIGLVIYVQLKKKKKTGSGDHTDNDDERAPEIITVPIRLDS